jgi:hypothetical protein
MEVATPSPLSKDAWRALRAELAALQEELRLSREHETACSICLQEMEQGKRALFTTSCGHTYHFACIKQLHVEFSGEPVAACCPLCRKPFTSQTPPRTPFAKRAAGLPGFMSARAALGAAASAVPMAAPENMATIVEVQAGCDAPRFGGSGLDTGDTAASSRG